MAEICDDLRSARETVWLNPHRASHHIAAADNDLTKADIDSAEDVLKRAAPWLARTFPDTAEGIIESPLMRTADNVWVKLDSHLPISGSIKARGGIYAVLKLAEDLGGELGDAAFFSRFRIVVASTGNLGLSIGIMSAAIGFQVTVHMSRDARQWKKDLLRVKGCEVIEHEGDFTYAVSMARESAHGEDTFFIDDENSRDLFLGYAVAGRRLAAQLAENGVEVSAANPLHVYLPCGVGGGPGGVLFGLVTEFGDNAYCYFVEPTQAPSMTLGLATELFDEIAVSDLGLDGVTVADGLAVGRTSAFVGKRVRRLVTGCVTASDETMLRDMRMFHAAHGVFLEPSAAAGFSGYRAFAHLGGTHIIWATGGSMVPEDERRAYLAGGTAGD